MITDDDADEVIPSVSATPAAAVEKARRREVERARARDEHPLASQEHPVYSQETKSPIHRRRRTEGPTTDTDEVETPRQYKQLGWYRIPMGQAPMSKARESRGNPVAHDMTVDDTPPNTISSNESIESLRPVTTRKRITSASRAARFEPYSRKTYLETDQIMERMSSRCGTTFTVKGQGCGT